MVDKAVPGQRTTETSCVPSAVGTQFSHTPVAPTTLPRPAFLLRCPQSSADWLWKTEVRSALFAGRLLCWHQTFPDVIGLGIVVRAFLPCSARLCAKFLSSGSFFIVASERQRELKSESV